MRIITSNISRQKELSIFGRASVGPMKIIEWLKLPQTRRIEDLDDPAVTLLRAQVIQSKPFLKKTYIDFYRRLLKAVPRPEAKVLVELGSGGGFLKDGIGKGI